MTNVELSPGIIIDTQAERAYVMAPEGGVKAISITDGEQLWQSDAAEKPLVLLGELLVSQSTSSGPVEALTVRTLRVNQEGTVASENAVPIPEGVSPMIEPKAHLGFNLSAEAEGDDAVLRWEYRERPLRGLASGEEEILPGEELPAIEGSPTVVLEVAPAPVTELEETVIRGQVRLTLGVEDAIRSIVEPSTELELPTVPQFPSERPEVAPPASVLESVLTPFDPHTFLSADQRHRLESRRIEDTDSILPEYRWTLFSVDSDTPLGTIDIHLSFAPFIVIDDRLVVELQPFSHRAGTEMLDEPMQLRAYELANGAEVWRTSLRDIYAVPEPPH